MENELVNLFIVTAIIIIAVQLKVYNSSSLMQLKEKDQLSFAMLIE
jgi:hypothetical protein